MGLADYARAVAHLLDMKRNQWLSRGELEALTEERLLKVVRHASGTVPFYRKRSVQIRSMEDLPSIPITRKADVQAGPESFISSSARGPLHLMHTSGSSGLPLKLFFDRADSAYGIALGYHCITECGFGPADLLVSITASSRMPHPLRKFVYRMAELPVNTSDGERAAALSSLRPDIVLAYPSAFAAMALSGRKAHFGRAFTCSESLTPSLRRLIESSFGCSVRDFYGANECWSLGFECEKGRMHINSDSVLLEILDEEGNPAKRGNVVITSLWRYSMPFIRYDLGDIASLAGPCPCGRGTAVLGPIEGRASSMVALDGGSVVPWCRIQVRLKKMDGFLQFQGFQESPGSLLIRVVSRKRSAALLSEIRKLAGAALGPGADVKAEFVDSIPKGKSGKTTDFVSRLKEQELIASS